jgi:hypothetical protein
MSTIEDTAQEQVTPEVEAEATATKNVSSAEPSEADAEDAADQTEAKADDAETDKEDDAKPKKRRNERNRQRWRDMKSQLSRAEREIERLRGYEKPDFSKIEDYDEALAERTAHKVREASLKDQEEQLNSTRQDAVEAMTKAWEESVEDAKQRYPDFDEKFNDKVPVHRSAVPLLVDAEDGADIAYWLASNTKAAAELYDLFETSPAQALMKMGEIRGKLSRPTSKKASTAPKPAKTIAGGQNPLSFDQSKASIDEMAAHLKKAGIIN